MMTEKDCILMSDFLAVQLVKGILNSCAPTADTLEYITEYKKAYTAIDNMEGILLGRIRNPNETEKESHLHKKKESHLHKNTMRCDISGAYFHSCSFDQFGADGTPIGWARRLAKDTILTSNQFEQSVSIENHHPTGLSELVHASDIPIVQDGVYLFTCYMAGFNVSFEYEGSSEIHISWHAADGSCIESDWSNALPSGDTPWTQVATNNIVPPHNAVSAMLHLSVENTSGKVSFREPMFRRIM